MSDIRRYISIIENLVLVEAQNYREMFNDVERLLALYDDRTAQRFRNDIETTITDVRRMLKKNDRVVWFLRLYKVGLIHELSFSETKQGTPQEMILSVEQAWQKQLDILAARSGLDRVQMGHEAIKAFRQRQSVLRDFEHFLSLPIPDIQNHIFGHEALTPVMNKFRDAEKAWKERTRDLIPHDPSDGEIVLKFPDGMFWQLLPRGGCRKEGEAMGHCGNVPSQAPGDRILSLRRLVKEGKETYVRPSLTFILHANGYLGEMKGRGNDKPAAKYHPHIVALLKLDLIKGIQGGGYLPKHNFSLNDLDDATRETLIDEKPSLGTLRDYVRKVGIDEHVRSTIEREIEYTVSWLGDDFQRASVMHWMTFAELVADHGDRTAQWVASVLNGDEQIDTDYYWSDDWAETVFDDLPKETVVKIGEHLKTAQADAIEQWEEENDETFDPTDARDVRAILQETGDEVWDDLKRAAESGGTAGMHDEMLKALKHALDVRLPVGELRFRNETGAFAFDTPVDLLLTIDDLVRVVSDPDELDEFNRHLFGDTEISISHRHDFSDFDHEAAVSSFFDEHGDWAAPTKWEKQREAAKLKKEQLAAIDTSGWTVDTTNSDWRGTETKIIDPQGKVVARRYGYRGNPSDAVKDDMIRDTIWQATYGR